MVQLTNGLRGIEKANLTDSFLESIHTVRIVLSISSGFLHRDHTLLTDIPGFKKEAKLNKSFACLLSGNSGTKICSFHSVFLFNVQILAKLGTFKNLLLLLLNFNFTSHRVLGVDL